MQKFILLDKMIYEFLGTSSVVKKRLKEKSSIWTAIRKNHSFTICSCKQLHSNCQDHSKYKFLVCILPHNYGYKNKFLNFRALIILSLGFLITQSMAILHQIHKRLPKSKLIDQDKKKISGQTANPIDINNNIIVVNLAIQ